MAIFDYGTEAELSSAASEEELFPARRPRMRQPTGYGRFARTADAIRFASRNCHLNFFRRSS
jgi:hypothetical protein